MITQKTAVLASLAALWCSPPAGADTIDQLYAMAKKEKTLVVWAADPTAGYEGAIRAFEQQFPGITVSLTGGFSVLNSGIEEQVWMRKVNTDLVILQTIQDFLAWNRRQLLLPFKPDGFGKVDTRSKDKDGAWIAVIEARFSTATIPSRSDAKTCQDWRLISCRHSSRGD